MWFPLPIPFALLLGETGLIYDDHSICVCTSMSVYWSQSFCLGPQSLHQGLTKGRRKQILASSYKFCEEAEKRFYSYPCRRRGWHMWSQREGRIPENSSTMGKVSAKTHNHWTQIFRRVGMFTTPVLRKLLIWLGRHCKTHSFEWFIPFFLLRNLSQH